MSLKRKCQDSENACPAPKKIEFEGQVAKLPKDFVAFQTWSMEKALGIDLILERVFEHLPYADLKKARSVNSFWNRIANPLFRKRSIIESDVNKDHKKDPLCFSSCQELIKKEAVLPNQNLAAKAPLWIELFLHGYKLTEGRALMDALQVTPTWFSRVQKLSLFISTMHMNRFLPFLLHQMPVLEILHLFRDNSCGSLCKCNLDENLVVPPVPENVNFPLAKVVIHFGLLDSSSSLDPEFLRQCPNLKTFRADLGDSLGEPLEFIEFFKSWKRIRSDATKYEVIEIRNFEGDIGDEGKRVFCETLAEFINLNQCKSLNLECAIWGRNLSSSAFLKSQYLWTSGVLPRLQGTYLRQLKIALPSKYRDYSNPESTLKILRQCPAFAKVTDLTLIGHYLHDDNSIFQPDPSLVTHNLESVTSLTLINSGGRINTIFLDNFPTFGDRIKCLQNLTSVRILSDGHIRVLNGHLNYDYIFENLKSFPKLVELELGIVYSCFERRLEGIREGWFKGHFAGLGMLTGLRKFKLTLGRDETMTCQNALVLFFNGYEPHVNLEMEKPRKSGFDNRQSPADWTFTVEEFKEALKAAEAVLLVDPPQMMTTISLLESHSLYMIHEK